MNEKVFFVPNRCVVDTSSSTKKAPKRQKRRMGAERGLREALPFFSKLVTCWCRCARCVSHQLFPLSCSVALLVAIFISRPSPSRWHCRSDYVELVKTAAHECSRSL